MFDEYYSIYLSYYIYKNHCFDYIYKPVELWNHTHTHTHTNIYIYIYIYIYAYISIYANRYILENAHLCMCMMRS